MNPFTAPIEQAEELLRVLRLAATTWHQEQAPILLSTTPGTNRCGPPIEEPDESQRYVWVPQLDEKKE